VAARANHCQRTEWSYGWEAPPAQRLRFVLDFAYGTGPRVSELVGACLGNIETDARGDPWVSLVGKGHKAGKVALPPLARTALDRYLVERRLPVTPSRWHPDTPLVGSLEQDSAVGISDVRLWEITRRFFAKVAEVIESERGSRRKTSQGEPALDAALCTLPDYVL
jgi:site-specific recombinase XerD